MDYVFMVVVFKGLKVYNTLNLLSIITQANSGADAVTFEENKTV
jgi:hypothetical protein